MEQIPLRKARSNWVARKDYIPHRLLLQRAPKTTIFVVPAANQRDSPGSFAATASSTKLGEEGKKKKARRIHSCSRAPALQSPRLPCPLTARVSRVPGPEPQGGRDPGSRVPAAPGAPEGGDGRAGGGAASARGPPGRPHAPSRPALSRLPHLNSSRPPSSSGPLQPLPGGGLRPLLQSPARPLG